MKHSKHKEKNQNNSYMGKIIFYNLKKLALHQNCEIKKYQLEKQNCVLTNDRPYEGLYNSYYSVFQPDPNNHPSRIYLYYRASTDLTFPETVTARTCLSISNDGGLTFEKPESPTDHIILRGLGVNHNFTVCYDPIENNFKGVGGVHVPDDQIKAVKDTTKDLNLVKISWKKNDSRVNYYIYPGTKATDKQINGLYTYASDDGKQWNLESKSKPVLHGLSPGQVDRLRGFSNFDSAMSVFYHPTQKLFYLYARSNVTTNLRHIQYSTSSNFRDWTKFGLISLEPEPKVNSNHSLNENYYFPNINLYPDSDYFVGFPPYFCWTLWKIGIYLILSENGHDFERLQMLLPTKFWNKKQSVHSVNGIIKSPDNREFWLYMHHGLCGANNLSPEIWRYSIRRDGFTSIYSQDGYFTLPIKFDDDVKQTLALNYRCQNGGFLTLTIEDKDKDKDKDVIYGSDKLVGDQLDYRLEISLAKLIGNYLVKIYLKNAEIFSLII